jgi:hypothetical protein
MEDQIPFTQDDFKDGISAKEKYDLACDLLVITQGLQNHDQSIFQMIAALNTVKKILIDNGTVTDEEYQKTLVGELESIQKLFAEQVQKFENEKAETKAD